MSLLCRQLGRVVVGSEDPSIENTERNQLVALADSLIDKYQKEKVLQTNHNKKISKRQIHLSSDSCRYIHFRRLISSVKSIQIISSHSNN
jgi:hypothetical protein